jgi:hypothetical protein
MLCHVESCHRIAIEYQMRHDLDLILWRLCLMAISRF